MGKVSKSPKIEPAKLTTKNNDAPSGAALKNKVVDSNVDSANKSAEQTTAKEAIFISPLNDNIHKMIQEAAYYITERNNFSGDRYAYWMEAESEIIQTISR